MTGRPALRGWRLLAAVLVLGVAGVTQAQWDDGGVVSEWIDVDGRMVLVVWPQRLDPSLPAPVLIVLHGYGGEGAWVADHFGLDVAATDAGMVTIVPQGTRDPRGRTFWNAARACCDFFGAGVDDVGFVEGLVDAVGMRLRDRVSLDRRRAYLFGLSNGGFLAYRIACTRPGTFAAIANVAGAMDVGGDACPSPAPIGVLHVHGTDDETIAETGGELATVRYTGAKETVQVWLDVARCGAWETSPRWDLEPTVAGAETLARKATCNGGVQVAWWQIDGGAHVPEVSVEFARGVTAFLLEHTLP